MATIGTNYDPTSTATALAQVFTAGRQQTITQQGTQATATSKALGTLGSALSAFQTSLASMTGVNKTLAAASAVFSDTSVGSATATASAMAGTYSFFVERLATAHKLSYSRAASFTAAAGDTLDIKVGTASFNVALQEGTTYTPRDLAAAINKASGNTNVSASVVSGTDENGAPFSELVLTSKLTGEANKIVVTAAGPNVASALGTGADLVAPLDALVHVGTSSGTAIKSATNTLNVIDGVTMTFSKAQSADSDPVTLTVGTDTAKTTANVQAFVDAYNKLKSAVDGLVAPGDPAAGSASGAFASDSGVRALRDRLVSLVRGTGSTSLAGYGIIANRDGTLGVDSSKLTKALAANPTGLDTLIGSASLNAPTGIAGKLDTYIKVWTNSTNGQIGTRKEAVTKLQDTLATRQTELDRQYDSAYKRYLAQFTQLQSIQSSMSYNTSLFSALFSDSKD
jgi:flagellar hook-associated protein 2